MEESDLTQEIHDLFGENELSAGIPSIHSLTHSLTHFSFFH